MNSSVKLAVFDCDGTLVDSQGAIVAAMHATCDAHGLDRLTDGQIRRVVGLPLAEAIARLLPGVDAERLDSLRRFYGETFAAMRASGELSEPLFPGALEGLAAVERAGWLLGMATGKSRRGAMATLGRHGLADRFVTVQTADGGPGKPHPDMLEKAMAETGASRSGTVMIGDTSFDMLMARSAGTFAIGVAWGYHDRAELLRAGAHCVVGRFDELCDAVQGLAGGGP